MTLADDETKSILSEDCGEAMVVILRKVDREMYIVMYIEGEEGTNGLSGGGAAWRVGAGVCHHVGPLGR